MVAQMSLIRTDAPLLSFIAVSLAAGQYLFKRAGLSIQGQPIAKGLLSLAVSPSLYVALALYGGTTLLWIFVLSRVPITLAYPWIAAATAAVPVIGWLAFGEHVGPAFWVGFAMILIGLTLTQLSAGN
jgi:drug/metabolite transporter (DMT)-like permease